MNQTIPFRSAGSVELYRLPAAAGDSLADWRRCGVLVSSGRNDLVFSGVDVMARLLAGQGRLDGLYLEFANGIDPAAFPPPAVNPRYGVEYYTGLSGAHDYMRVPLRVDGALEASDSRYVSNRVRFLGTSGGAAGARGLPFSASAGSAVYGAALVMLGKTPADDLVYARYSLPRAEAISDNQAVGISWTLTLTHPQH